VKDSESRLLLLSLNYPRNHPCAEALSPCHNHTFPDQNDRKIYALQGYKTNKNANIRIVNILEFTQPCFPCDGDAA
jgi:hypothetical protein